MNKSFAFVILLIFGMGTLSSQEYFPDNTQVKSQNNNYTAIVNAKIYVSPSKVIENGTLLIKKGKVMQVGKSVKIPANTVKIDVAGKWIYPSFIDVFSEFGVDKPEKSKEGGRSAEYEPSRQGYYWNDHIMPEFDAASSFVYDESTAKNLREAGFGVVNTHRHDGIARGTGVLVALNEKEAMPSAF